MPDGRNDTPLGPGGHRNWPAHPAERPTQHTMEERGRSMSMGQSPNGSNSRRNSSGEKWAAEGTGGGEGTRGTEGNRGAEGNRGMEGNLEYEMRGPVHPTLQEPHETVKESTVVRAAPRYENDRRKERPSDTERVFSGQSSYDRMGTDSVGRVSSRRAPFFIDKQDLLRAVVMTEILGPPRGKGFRQTAGRFKRR